jgi:hypothetical protein
VSSTGRLRFSLYNSVEEIREKTEISGLHSHTGLFFDMMFASAIITGISSMIGIVVGSLGLELMGNILILPFILNLIVMGFLIVYTMFRSSLLVLSGIFDSDYIEVRC